MLREKLSFDTLYIRATNYQIVFDSELSTLPKIEIKINHKTAAGSSCKKNWNGAALITVD